MWQKFYQIKTICSYHVTYVRFLSCFFYELSGCGFESRCSHLNYLRPLCKKSKIYNQWYTNIFKHVIFISTFKEDVSYDAESLFTNIPIEETINYITEKIYVHKKLTPICSKLIFSRLIKWKMMLQHHLNLSFITDL